MEEIKVGEYVRNEDGYIWQIKKLEDLDNIFVDEAGKVRERVGETVFGDEITIDVVKHNKNIIDLIEVGDIVHIKDVLNEDIIYVWSDDYLKALKEDLNNGIKLVEIVTREQFKIVSYEV